MLERNFRIGSIPVRAIAQDDSTDRPVVLFYHGLHTSKETHEPELRSLAGQGFLALGIDFQGHGERAIGDLKAFLARAPWPDQAFRFILPTLEEIPLLIDVLMGEGYRRFGLMGISLGGLLAFGSPLVEPRLEAVVSILGCPYWGSLPNATEPERPDLRYLRHSPHHFPHSFERVRLLAWNGGQDVNIATPMTRKFMEDVAARFPHHPGLEYREYPESGHFMRPQDWQDGWSYSLDWLKRGLLGQAT